MSLRFLHGQIGYMRDKGLAVHALSSPGEELEGFSLRENIPVDAVSMTRRVTPLRDLLALVRIRSAIRRIRPSIVHAHTPKGGLLGMMAAILAGARIRIYHMRGLPFVTANGLQRLLLKLSERVSCRLAHVVFCNSYSLRTVALKEGICRPEKIKILGQGSGNGVDARERFNPATLMATVRDETRARFGIPQHATVIGFIGRVVKEKGIGELEEAWGMLRDLHPDAYLLIVGPFETRDPVPAHSISRLQEDRRVVLTGTEWNTPPLYAAMDVVVLPTYREGFPNVPLEAASMELPVVATNVPGCIDAVEDGRTGTLVPPRDATALARAIRMYLDDSQLRLAHGKAGRDRVLQHFRQEAIWEAMFDEYHKLLHSRVSDRPKRIFDFVAATVGLLFLAPILGIIGLCVWARMGRPVLFRQERPGYRGQPFVIYKFRTMVTETDENGDPLPDECRITPLGHFLRQTSLDELPELWNVMKGDMSLVGPRPLRTEYLPLYSSVQSRRHEVRPGITGLAQIQGRNATTWERRLDLDVWYVDHRTFRLDLSILLRTLLKVVTREGINQEGAATMEPFRGSPSGTSLRNIS